MIDLAPILYERGASGAPTSTFVTSLQGRMASYQHVISDKFGFESATIAYNCTLEEGLEALNAMLMRSLIVYGPHGRVCWEGLCRTVTLTAGGVTRSLSLDGMANRVRVAWTTVFGFATTTSTSSDSASIALYGTKDRVESSSATTQDAANNLAATVLATSKNPVMRPTTSIRSGDLGPISLQMEFSGWYDTLDWVVTERTDTTTESTTTQVGALIGTSSPGIGATNAFLATSTANIVSSGITDTRKIEAGTTYRQKIEGLLEQGNGTNRFAWGVYENRQFHVAVWAGATPTTITYRAPIGGGVIYDAAGSMVDPWDVRPNAMLEVPELLDVAPVTTAPDAAARSYVARVTCNVGEGGVSVDLEPSESDDLAARLAFLDSRGR